MPQYNDGYVPSAAQVRVILCNWGANDMHDGYDGATFETQYLQILDLLHTRYPYAKMGIASAWRRDYDVESATLRSHLLNIIAARDFTFDGIDESVILKDGDNGVAETDIGGVHYTVPVGATVIGNGWTDKLTANVLIGY